MHCTLLLPASCKDNWIAESEKQRLKCLYWKWKVRESSRWFKPMKEKYQHTGTFSTQTHPSLDRMDRTLISELRNCKGWWRQELFAEKMMPSILSKLFCGLDHACSTMLCTIDIGEGMFKPPSLTINYHVSARGHVKPQQNVNYSLVDWRL